tara:strand:+ start:23748 stop:23954 length:207 start_codon:yes stop_codon:yes gene_type:complete
VQIDKCKLQNGALAALEMGRAAGLKIAWMAARSILVDAVFSVLFRGGHEVAGWRYTARHEFFGSLSLD